MGALTGSYPWTEFDCAGRIDAGAPLVRGHPEDELASGCRTTPQQVNNTMSISSQIEDKVRAHFSPDHLEVINESHNHNVAPGSSTHFKLIVVAAAFQGKTAVTRHRSLYGILGDELQNGVHALALHLYTPEEWAQIKQAPESPECLGGSAQ